MREKKLPPLQRTHVSSALVDPYTDFMLSREAKNATANTLEFYELQLGYFILWAVGNGIDAPASITSKLIRQYLADLRKNGKADRSRHAAARAIKTFVKFLHKERYISELPEIEMPKIAKKRLPILNEEQLKTILRACNLRDRAIVLFMADCGARNSEVCNLNWEDVNMQTGLVTIKQGKGQKDRATVIGASARRALLAYKRTVDHGPKMPLFQSRTHERFTRTGLLIVYRRLSKATGIHVTAHAMRRTFTILSLHAHMDPGHIQAMMGQTSLDMVYYYAEMADEDLIREHKAHSPIDSIR